ncbi:MULTISPECIES: response regulator transcription factor [Nitrospirillum]|uniref:response regulator transcription factor n=1 Tax=Nitrospirillum amazonense TaxID=28077 RepID=UPI001B3B911F|nr:response regulator transcription factor [Nitrospirillum amazonense]MEC4590357.1 response regulator transcription factor [Nitrospirillum amazonense]
MSVFTGLEPVCRTNPRHRLSHFTVRTFTRRIYSKLEVTSKAEAVYEARMLGLLNR